MSDWQNALDNALQAADRHQFGVVPLSLTKLPAIRSPHDKGHGCKGECGQLGHGIHDASNDPDRIRTMFEAARHATGYGIACGRAPHFLIGLDLDRDREKDVDGVWELRRLCARKGIAVPRTVIIRTPRGGYHAWWTGPSDVKVPNRAGQLAPGIDVRGAGGYLVGPGSRGARGLYTLASDPDDVTVRPIPDPLLQLMTADKERPRRTATSPANTWLMGGGRALVGLVKHVLDSAEGQRNNRLFWAACKAFEHAAAGHLNADAAEDALMQAAVEVGLPDKEAEATLKSARGEVLGAA
ncbi:bifunctional DNA primase/polymerase [Streptomyces sp. AK02-04a]|uniref:bifunctional DNA primase/polymerase n=1 Tax=Streptomyces sp. AK02-04a TaxID=3028649 RepID=UPI0029ADCC0D|nr:bifunctional DNA primase/polymerase [Streptomyces sp. AK02-04a]MDX3753995.1 bifunctional DNA primase/polymerase [Streptomyces sp. AK02-04a]